MFHRTIALMVTALTAIFAVIVACTNLGAIPLNVCGNDIVEPGEECDTFPKPTDDAANTCYPPDTSGACHLACAVGTRSCPKGWQCGVDAVCRRPSGTFQSLGAAVTSDVRELAISDFDGDGRLDVVTRGAGTTSVHFFDDTGALANTSSISVSRGAIATGDLTGSGLSNLLVLDSLLPQRTAAGIQVIGTGVELWRGQSDRSLATTLFESFPINKATDSRIIPLTLGLPTSPVGGNDLVVFTQGQFGEDGGFMSALGYFDPGTGFQFMSALATPQAKVIGDIPAGRVNKSAPCDSVVVGIPGEAQVAVYQGCAIVTTDAGAMVILNAGEPPPIPPFLITFPSAIQGAVLLLDTNGDGNLDVVTGIDSGTEWGVEIALGDGTGAFTNPTAFIPVHGSGGAPLLTGTVIAAGFIDGDAKLDYVDMRGVALSGLASPIAASGTLVAARVEDMNANGLVDVVGISSNGVDFYNGTGTVLMNHQFYDVPATMSLTVGDVDGDFNEDVVIATSGSPSNLSVLYGQLDGYPQQPLLIGTLATTSHLASGLLTWFFGDPPDAIASVIGTAIDQQGPMVVPIQGHADRQLTSPFLLSRTSGMNYVSRDVPLAATIGNIPASLLDASSLAILGCMVPDAAVDQLSLQLWTAIPSDASSVLSSSDAGLVVPTGASATIVAGANARGAGVVAIDWDPANNNGDEVAVVVPTSQDDASPGGFYVLGFGTFDAGMNVWSVLHQEPFDGAARVTHAASVPVRVARADFDGDGLDDLLIVYGDEVEAGNDTHVLAEVLFNDGNASLSLSTAVQLPMPTTASGAAPINALGDGTMQVAVVSDQGISLMTFAAGTRTLGVLQVLDAGGGGSIGFAGDVDLVCGDVNGDGVDDVVAASDTQFAIALGIPVVK